ncbi:MAG: GtrA family protein [Clostridia bacterium]|nr:GtrA family protein [Clostridia bacterium]
MKIITDLFKKYREIIMYLIFGVSTTAVNWVVYTTLVVLHLAGVTAANAVAWVCAVLFAFVTNKLFVFQSHTAGFISVLKESVTFFGARIFSGLFEIFLPTLLISLGLDGKLFGIDGFVAKAVVSILIIIMNYVLSKLIVFRNKDKK